MTTKIIFILTAPFIISSCSSINRNFSNLLFPPYPNSDQRQGEDTIAYVTQDKNCNALVDESGNPITTNNAALASAAAEFFVKETEKFFQEEAKRYTATYSASAIGGYFSCTGEDINLKKITLHRRTERYHSDEFPAMELDLDVVNQPDNMAFQILPRKIALRQSKAKVAAIDITRPFGFDILAPWTIFQTFSGAGSFNSLDDFGKGLSGFSPLRPSKVDLFVDIKLIGVWIDKDQKGHTDEIASRTLQVPGVEIGSCINFQAPKSYKNTSESQLSDLNKKLTKLSQEKDVSNDQKTQEINNLILETNLLIDEDKQLFAQQDNCVDEQTETVNSGYLSEWKRELFLRVPRSYRFPHGKSPTTDRSYGNYIVTVSVKEVDNFGERIMNISDTIKQNDTSIIKAIQSIGE